MKKTWLLVADASAATLIACSRKLEEPEVLESFVHPASRLRDTELATDDRGRTQPRDMGAVRGSAMSKAVGPHEAEAEKFARELGAYLDQAAADGKYEELVIAAAPRFLGLIKEALGSRSSDSIRAAVPKDYATQPPATVVKLVRKALDLA